MLQLLRIVLALSEQLGLLRRAGRVATKANPKAGTRSGSNASGCDTLRYARHLLREGIPNTHNVRMRDDDADSREAAVLRSIQVTDRQTCG